MNAPIRPLTSQSLRPDGKRVKLHPAEAQGRYGALQRWLYPTLILVYAALPWIRFHGAPLVFVDIEHRHFYFFGLTFNSSDFYLSFFVVSGLGFALIVLSALVGRVWCGYACPQTVFLEGVARRIETLVEGRPGARAARERGAWTAGRVARFGLKHLLFVLSAFLIANIFISYFASLEQVLRMARRPPLENWGAFLWMAAITGVIYFDFAWFREQVCVVICPYGRLQSVLADRDTLIVGYDALRGEPRARRGTEGAGDCVDCKRCVQVCPTGIDIRNGLQLECVGCAHCIDACNEVMIKIGRPSGLIRYDSQAGLQHQPRRFIRPRLAGYAVAMAAGLVALTVAVSGRNAFGTTLARAQRAPYERVGDVVVNRFLLHVSNKGDASRTLHLEYLLPTGARVEGAPSDVPLPGFEQREIPFVVESPPGLQGARSLTVRATDGSGEHVDATVVLLGG